MQKLCVAASLGILLLAATAGVPADASGAATGLTTAETKALTAGMVAFAHIPVDSDQLVVLAENAKVVVHHDAAAGEITVASSCPHDWNVTGSSIRQAGFSTRRNGVAMMADPLGSRAIVNGRIYSLPNGQITGGISMGKDGLFIGGKKVDPIEGSDVPGSCSGPDEVDITVPDRYTGNLIIGAGEKSDVNVDAWKGGTLQVTLVSNASMRAGDLTSLSKAALNLHGDGNVEIDNLNARVLVANINGKGSLTVRNGKADMTNATVTGDGTITMKGTFKNLKQAVQGNGKIKVN